MSAAFRGPEATRGFFTAAEDASTGCGVVRARQLHWVAGEIVAWLQAEGRASVGPAEFFAAGDLVAIWLEAADAGRLRRRAAGDEPRPCAASTCRVRRDCFRSLAAAAQAAAADVGRMPAPAVRGELPLAVARGVLERLRARAASPAAAAVDVRAAAIAQVVVELGLRTGELASLRPGDVDVRAGTLTFRPCPPGGPRVADLVTVAMSSSLTSLLARWLAVREELVRAVPRSAALWVSVHGNHDGRGVRRPAGLPLRPNGIRRAHRRAVIEVNAASAGSPGFTAAPAAPSRLRRTG